ncbi:MAG: TonB family protein [Aridibacter sp.]
MREKILLIICTFCLLISANAQENVSKVGSLKELNLKVVEKYKAGDFKDALELAEKSLALTVEIFGENNKETALVYANIAEINMARKKYDDATENFKKAVSILEIVQKDDQVDKIKYLDRLGTSLALDGKEKEAKEVFEKLLNTAENKYGKENKEIILYLKTTTDFYIFTKEYDRAEELFVRRHLLSKKLFGKESDELEIIGDEFQCFTSRAYDPKKGIESYERFRDATKTDNDDSTKQGVVNGKARLLQKPKYPVEARKTRSGGVYTIKIEIDEKGKVTTAKSICGGNKYLEEASVEAAFKSKFEPTTVNGEPKKVTGYIVYRYVP